MKLTSLNLKKIPFSKETVRATKKDVGVYVFWDENKEPLYVGKSTNLKNRLDSYLSNDLEVKTRAMVSLARYISTIPVTSELESLLLEAFLVKTNQPKYNIELKDDKSPLYIKITKEEYPRVITARKGDILIQDTAHFYGPFPSSTNVKMILQMLRRVFPFATHKPMKRACLYAQMGLCKPCPSTVQNTEDILLRGKMKSVYKRNISYIKMVLSGRMRVLKRELVRKMEIYAKDEDYEGAQAMKSLLEKLDYITQPITPTQSFLENPNLVIDLRIKELNQLSSLLSKYMVDIGEIRRIECFDIAHIAGSYPTASMVTFIDGEADKRFYRHFKIDPKHGGDDYASLAEVATRRKKHFNDPKFDKTGWGKPDLIIVDGGKGQLKVFMSIFAEFNIPIVGLAKREETLIIQNQNQLSKSYSEIRLSDGPVLYLVQRMRNEAHRFARRLHHKLVSKSLTSM